MKAKCYDVNDISNFIDNELVPRGFECTQTWEGSLGIGNWICTPTQPNQYAFIVREKFLNSQSSYHTMMKVRMPLPKKYKQELDEYYAKEVM